MPQTSYPAGNDLRDFLATTGITPSNLTDYDLSAAAGVRAFENAIGRFMLAGSSETRSYDLPEHGNVVELDDVVGTPTVAYQPNGATSTPWTDGTHYELFDRNAPRYGKPYRGLKILSCYGWGGWGYGSDYGRGAIKVTGTFGYGLTIPDDAWDAMRIYGAMRVFNAGVLNTTGGAQSWASSATGYSETKSPVAYSSVLSDWQMQVKATVDFYSLRLRRL